jgi:hypothetical protein
LLRLLNSLAPEILQVSQATIVLDVVDYGSQVLLLRRPYGLIHQMQLLADWTSCGLVRHVLNMVHVPFEPSHRGVILAVHGPSSSNYTNVIVGKLLVGVFV